MLFAAFFFPAAAAVIVYFMKYLSDVVQVRVRLGQDEAYRARASQVALAEMHGRLVTVEKILREVE
ncbi:hypothetical protein [Undibacterium umbellatum]|uniref:Uncharacterized protein n=1 Tax=Undibacterium umbellatum TaxID=2762300 RepID=A0ABR6Z8X6_9BURK|nr:hypothetical protein [Undibacterium umbellatum]MBC3908224.1 hypothetical protein [Undibacterium umbellatum]